MTSGGFWGSNTGAHNFPKALFVRKVSITFAYTREACQRYGGPRLYAKQCLVQVPMLSFKNLRMSLFAQRESLHTAGPGVVVYGRWRNLGREAQRDACGQLCSQDRAAAKTPSHHVGSVGRCLWRLPPRGKSNCSKPACACFLLQGAPGRPNLAQPGSYSHSAEHEHVTAWRACFGRLRCRACRAGDSEARPAKMELRAVVEKETNLATFCCRRAYGSCRAP